MWWKWCPNGIQRRFQEYARCTWVRYIYSLLCIFLLLCNFKSIISEYIFSMASCYSVLLIHVKSSDYINCVKLYFSCDEEELFWDCLLRCRTCLVSLVPSSRAVGNIAKVSLEGLPVWIFSYKFHILQFRLKLSFLCLQICGLFFVIYIMWVHLFIEARVLRFALLYCILMCCLVFKWAAVFKHGQRWNSLQAVTLTFESVAN